MVGWRKLGFVMLSAILLAGCASAPSPGAPKNLNDPFEPVNRVSFEVGVVIDKALVRPVAVVYRGVVPVEVRNAIRNVLNNLNSLSVFANNLLQGEMERAGVTLARAFINSSVGIGGIFEIAEGWGLPRHHEDFGQTLAVWGVGEEPYMFVPLIGPANLRDLVGRGVDYILDPLAAPASAVDWARHGYIPTVRGGVDLLDLRARHIKTLDDIELTSVDFYASVRSLYRQARKHKINNGAAHVEELPDF